MSLSREVQEAFERLLQVTPSRAKSRPVSRYAETEAAALYTLAQRLRGLQYLTASARLRHFALARALATPQPRRRRAFLELLPSFLPQRPNLVMAVGRMAAAVAAALVVSYGAIAASAASPPDSPLYTVKLLVDDVRVAVASTEEKARIYVEQASRRLEETDILIQSGRIESAERSAHDAARRIESARAVAEQVAPQPEVREAISSTVAQYRSVSESLERVGGSAPPIAAVAVHSAPEASGPTAGELAALEGQPASDARAAPSIGGVQAPVPTSGFARIDQRQPTAQVAAPRSGAPSEFVPIDGNTGATLSRSTVAGPAPTFIPIGASDASTPAPAPSATPTAAASSTSVATATATPTPTPTTGSAAPSGPFTPIGDR